MGLQIRILVSMLALVMLALACTLVVAYRRSAAQERAYNEQRLERKEHAVARSLEYALGGDAGALDAVALATRFSDRICELSDVHGVSISLYTLEGELAISSTAGAPSDSTAWLRIPEKVMEGIFEQGPGPSGVLREWGEDVDFGGFVQAFWIFSDVSGEPVGIANFRYDKRAYEGEDFAGFVQGLAPVYMALLVLTVGLAVLLARTVTRPIRELVDGMRSLEPGADPVQLEYGGRDAIGDLVEQYNRLHGRWQESAEALAQSERENVWRTMVAQVAHEVKNPLTPLRLGVQHVEKAWHDQSPDFGERLSRFTASATHQIDALTALLDDFTLMASVDPENDRTPDLRWPLTSGLELHAAAHPGIRYTADLPDNSVAVLGSERHWLRVVNNLLTNAEEAIAAVPDRAGAIRISLHVTGGTCAFEVQDNGEGMAEETLSHIFEPRFSTRSRGSGLGLSMVSNVVAQCGGRISAESMQGRGTTVKVQLPIA
ncbi:MAG: ATP-binding protein [Flavobacteriales bacterium]